MSPQLASVLDKIRQADLPFFAGVELSGSNVRDRGFGETPLHVVAVWGDAESSRILIEEGALMDVPGEHGCTPLHEAAIQGHVEVVKLVLGSGADRTRRSEFGNFAEIASRSDNPEIRKLVDR